MQFLDTFQTILTLGRNHSFLTMYHVVSVEQVHTYIKQIEINIYNKIKD